MGAKVLLDLTTLIHQCFNSPEDCVQVKETITEWYKNKYNKFKYKMRPYVHIQREPIDLGKVLKITTQPYALFTIEELDCQYFWLFIAALK